MRKKTTYTTNKLGASGNKLTRIYKPLRQKAAIRAKRAQIIANGLSLFKLR